MARIPSSVTEFLSLRRLAVAGVSRAADIPANFIFRRLRDSGYDVVPVNPTTDEVEGVRCYRDLGSVPGEIDGVVIATSPAVSADVVRQAADRGVRAVWFHRSFGEGSVSDDALRECRERGVKALIGGCPLMYCGKVDIGHRCMRWILGMQHRLPA